MRFMSKEDAIVVGFNVKVKAAADALAAERRPLGAGVLERKRGRAFRRKGVIGETFNGTSLVYMRGSLAEKFLVMSRARARFDLKQAPLKRSRRFAEVGAFDGGRPPPLHWAVPTGNQKIHSISTLLVRHQAVGGPGDGETGSTHFIISLKQGVSHSSPCSPRAFGWRVFYWPNFRGTVGARRVPFKYSAPVLAAHWGRFVLSAFGESGICFRSRHGEKQRDTRSLMCSCT